MTIEEIMGAKLGEVGEEDKVSIGFKKTINIKPYESEVMEVNMDLKVPSKYSGAERMLVMAILQAQAEYEVYCMLVFKGQISREEFGERKKELEDAVEAIKRKAEDVLGVDMSGIIGLHR